MSTSTTTPTPDAGRLMMAIKDAHIAARKLETIASTLSLAIADLDTVRLRATGDIALTWYVQRAIDAVSVARGVVAAQAEFLQGVGSDGS